MRTRRLPAVVASFPALFFAGSLGAALAQAGAVELQVQDAGGEKIARAQVTAVLQGATETYRGETNKKGRYEGTYKTPGVYDITVSKEGLADITLALEVASGMTSSATVTMVDQATMNRQLAVEAFNEGVAALQRGDENAALESFQRAQELDPNLPDAPRLIAAIAANTDDFETAGAAVERFLELAPDQLQAVAPAAYAVDRHEGRSDRLEQLRELMRSGGQAQDMAVRVFNEGVAAVRDEDIERAEELFEEALLLDPSLAQAHRSLAAIAFNAQRYDETLEHVAPLLAAVPQHKEGHRLTFFSHWYLDHEDEAQAAATAWIEVAGDDAVDELLSEGTSLFEANRAEEAAALFDVLVAAAPQNGFAHYNLGRALASLGRTAEAKEHLRHFLELAPQHPEAEAARQMLAGL